MTAASGPEHGRRHFCDRDSFPFASVVSPHGTRSSSICARNRTLFLSSGTIHSVDRGKIRRDAGGVRKDFVPFPERTVGGDQRASILIATRDRLEQQVGATVGVG